MGNILSFATKATSVNYSNTTCHIADYSNDRCRDAVVWYCGIMFFLWLDTFWRTYLMFRQIRVCQTSTELPNGVPCSFDNDVFKKSRLYTIDKLSFTIFRTISNSLLLTSVLHFGLLYTTWTMAEGYVANLRLPKNAIFTTILYMHLIDFLQAILEMPFIFYNVYIIEQRYGFNTMSLATFFKDYAKFFLFDQFIGLPISTAIFTIASTGGKFFYIWLWLFFCTMIIFFLIIYPLVIAPMFDDFTPLQDGSLRIGIEKLALSQHFPLKQLYVVRASSRSLHSNAYFEGVGDIRIVLYDTLLRTVDPVTGATRGCNDQQVIAILAHELGHWKLNHAASKTLLAQFNMFIEFFIVGNMFHCKPLYAAIGFPAGIKPFLPIFLAIVEFILSPYSTLFLPFNTYLCRKYENEADMFAADLKFAQPLAEALCILYKDNLTFPVTDWMHSAWFDEHPTLIERTKALNSRQVKTE